MDGSVPVTVIRKLSHVELVQSADTGSDVEAVNGPPPHVSDVCVGSIGPLDGVAAFRIGGSARNVTREKRKTRSSAGTGWTRFGVHIGDLRRMKASARLPRPPRRPSKGTEMLENRVRRTYQRKSENCVRVCPTNREVLEAGPWSGLSEAFKHLSGSRTPRARIQVWGHQPRDSLTLSREADTLKRGLGCPLRPL